MDEKLRSDGKCVVISGSQKGKPCVFKGFKVRGKSQNMCLPHWGKYWCATELRKNGQYKNGDIVAKLVRIQIKAYVKPNLDSGVILDGQP